MSRSGQGGFTLIELLVVIAIIAILAAILFPVFLTARAKAREAKCISNCRQLTMACLEYADAEGGFGPQEHAWGTDTWTSDITNGPLYRYLKTGVTSSGAVTKCPDQVPDSIKGRNRKWTITYNCYLDRPNFSFWTTGRWDWSSLSGIRYSLFSQPRRLPMWICENTDPRLGVVVNDTMFANEDITSFHHIGWAVISYLDGHIGRLRGGLMFNTAVNRDGTYLFHPAVP